MVKNKFEKKKFKDEIKVTILSIIVFSWFDKSKLSFTYFLNKNN